MSKVLLIYPKTGWDVKNVSVLLPLSVLYLGRPLRRAGYTPVIIDQRIDPRWDDTLRAHLAGGDVHAVGVSSMTGLQIKWGLAASAIVRRVAPRAPIVWGGVHASLMPMETAAHPLVDYVVRGEGEESFVGLLDALRDTREPRGLPSVTYIDASGEPVHGPRAPFIDLADALVPDYDLVNASDYITTQTLGQRDLAVTTSRGCPNRCSFCYNVTYANRHWRAQPAEAVAEHFAFVARRFGLSAILVKDDNFFVNKNRVIAIIEELKKRDVRVTVRAECRADYIARQWDEDFLRELFDAGFREMTIGAESGADRTLAELWKDLTVEEIRMASERLHRAGIAAKFTFMSGFPGETPEDLRHTLDLMLELVRENPLARVTPIHLYAPYPGTPMHDRAVAAGWNAPRTLEDWAQVDFHKATMPWIDARWRKRLERMSVSTYFLDGRTMPEYFSDAPVMRTLSRAYGAVVRWRARRNEFRFMPELWLMEQYRRASAMV